MDELQVPATRFEVAYSGKYLPGVFLQNAAPDAPVLLVIGGADTCFEDLFLTVGRNMLERGCSVALVDLPGQGITMADGLHWEAQAEKPIAAVADLLVERFGARAGRMALMGLSLGGYFVARAAGHDTRFATVIASTPFPNPAEMFALSAAEAMKPGRPAPTPAGVTVPFLSILGSGDSQVFARQAHAWHVAIRSQRKSFVLLDAASGGDGHVQVNNRLRLAQEASGWLDEIFAGQRTEPSEWNHEPAARLFALPRVRGA